MNLENHAEKIKAEQEAIEGRENENISEIGSIQPFGFLLAGDPSTKRVNSCFSKLQRLVSAAYRKILKPIFQTYFLAKLFTKSTMR